MRLNPNFRFLRIFHCFCKTDNPNNFHSIFAKFFSVFLNAASCCNYIVNNHYIFTYDVSIDNDVGIRIYLIPILYIVFTFASFQINEAYNIGFNFSSYGKTLFNRLNRVRYLLWLLHGINTTVTWSGSSSLANASLNNRLQDTH